jgi:hypothetical protein
MKSLKFLVFLSAVILFGSCKPDKAIMPNKDANLLFSFSNTVKGQSIFRSTSVHTNAAGNIYTIDLLKYYISNITLVDDKGIATNYKNYNLVDAFEVNSTSFLLDKKIPDGSYRKLIFYMGVDQGRNHTGAQEGALSVSNGMIWTWTFGYIFYKLEGHFTGPLVTTETPYQNHLGTDSALVKIEIPIIMDVKGVDRKVNINLDIDKIMGDANTKIDFTYDNKRQSNSGDEDWMHRITFNISKSFSVTGIE